jgi:hypothetical protein
MEDVTMGRSTAGRISAHKRLALRMCVRDMRRFGRERRFFRRLDVITKRRESGEEMRVEAFISNRLQPNVAEWSRSEWEQLGAAVAESLAVRWSWTELHLAIVHALCDKYGYMTYLAVHPQIADLRGSIPSWMPVKAAARND